MFTNSNWVYADGPIDSPSSSEEHTPTQLPLKRRRKANSRYTHVVEPRVEQQQEALRQAQQQQQDRLNNPRRYNTYTEATTALPILQDSQRKLYSFKTAKGNYELQQRHRTTMLDFGTKVITRLRKGSNSLSETLAQLDKGPTQCKHTMGNLVDEEMFAVFNVCDEEQLNQKFSRILKKGPKRVLEMCPFTGVTTETETERTSIPFFTTQAWLEFVGSTLTVQKTIKNEFGFVAGQFRIKKSFTLDDPVAKKMEEERVTPLLVDLCVYMSGLQTDEAQTTVVNFRLNEWVAVIAEDTKGGVSSFLCIRLSYNKTDARCGYYHVIGGVVVYGQAG